MTDWLTDLCSCSCSCQCDRLIVTLVKPNVKLSLKNTLNRTRLVYKEVSMVTWVTLYETEFPENKSDLLEILRYETPLMWVRPKKQGSLWASVGTLIGHQVTINNTRHSNHEEWLATKSHSLSVYPIKHKTFWSFPVVCSDYILTPIDCTAALQEEDWDSYFQASLFDEVKCFQINNCLQIKTKRVFSFIM